MSMRLSVSFNLALAVLLVLSGCAGDKASPATVVAANTDACTERDPCPVSFYALLSDPHRWNGSYVATMGYVSYGRSVAAFPDQFSSDNAILRNGIELIVDENHYDERFAATDVVRPIRGIFRVKGLRRDHLGQVNEYDFVGSIELARITPFSADAWSCESATESVKARYLRRGEPCPGRRIDDNGSQRE